ncbi:hypothetical protein PMJ10TS2_08380 [Paenibacillus melissococcoides]
MSKHTRGPRPPKRFSDRETLQDFAAAFREKRQMYESWGAEVVHVLTLAWVGCILDDRYTDDSDKVRRLKNLLAASSQAIQI